MVEHESAAKKGHAGCKDGHRGCLVGSGSTGESTAIIKVIQVVKKTGRGEEHYLVF